MTENDSAMNPHVDSNDPKVPSAEKQNSLEEWLVGCDKLRDKELVDKVLRGFDSICERISKELEEKHGLNFKTTVTREDGVQETLAIPHPYHSAKHAQVVNENSSELFKYIEEKCPWLIFGANASEYNTLFSKGTDYKVKLKNATEIFAKYVSMLALGHDIVQEGSIVDGKLIRKRGTEPGQNEYETAKRLVQELNNQFMDDADATLLLRQLGIVDEGGDRIKRDIFATYPQFEPNALLKVQGTNALRVYQPRYYEATIAGRIIAFADLYLPYNEDVGTAIFWSNAEFWEINQDMLKLAQKLHQLIELKKLINYFKIKTELINLLDGIKNWWERQSGFVSWLNENIETILDPANDKISEEEKKMITNFDPKGILLPPALATWHQIIEGFGKNIISFANLDVSSKIESLLASMNYDELGLSSLTGQTSNLGD